MPWTMPHLLLEAPLELRNLLCDDFDENDLLPDLDGTSVHVWCATDCTEDTTTSTLEL
jgi:hypothetical protein